MGYKLAFGVLFIALLAYFFVWDNFDPMVIDDKRVLITGASSGIGMHLAYEYSKLGARVLITARRVEHLKTVAEKCKELGAKQVGYYPADLGKAEDREAVVREVEQQLGGLDHLILNHAVLVKDWWKGSKQNMTTLLNVLNLNFVSYVDLASQTLPMLSKSRGSIGVLSSTAGKIPLGHYTYYGTSKFAVQGFFAALRQELLTNGEDVSVTLCVIALVETPMGNLEGRVDGEVKSSIYGLYDLFVETPMDTAKVIIRSVANREYEMYFGVLASVTVKFHRLAPFLVEFVGTKILTALPIMV